MFYLIAPVQNPPSAIHQETSYCRVAGILWQIQSKVLVGIAHT